MGNMEQDKTGLVLDTRPKPFVFVLMPFDPAFTDVYQLGIRVACEKAGAYAERLDEQIFNESMLQRIYNQIAKADVVVADMTGRNPNVFYEAGYAHALGKVVVLLTQDKDDIPFDLKHYRHIVYENVTGLLPQLEKTIKWAIKQASEKKRPQKPIMVYCESSSLAGNPTILVPTLDGAPHRTEFSLTYGNVDELSSVKCRMALWTSLDFGNCFWEKMLVPIAHPTAKYVFNCPTLMLLLPGEWRSDQLALHARDDCRLRSGSTKDILLRVSTALSSYDYPFTVKFK